MTKSKYKPARIRLRWWNRQPTEVRVAVIAGCFVVAAACVTVSGTLFALLIENILEQTNPLEKIVANVTMNSRFEQMGRSHMLFVRSLLNPEDDLYELSRGTCIEAQPEMWSDDVWIVLGETSDVPTFKERLLVSFETNIDISIHELELELVDFETSQPSGTYEAYYLFTGEFGGPGWGATEELDAIELDPRTKTYPVYHLQKYHLPAQDSVLFVLPFVSHEPGIYTLRAVASVSTFATSPQRMVSEDNIVIKWVDIRNVAVTEIGDSDDMAFRECP